MQLQPKIRLFKEIYVSKCPAIIYLYIIAPSYVCRYIGAAKLGDVLEVRSECIKQGKNLAFATVNIIRKNDGNRIAIGRQTKFVGF